MSDDKQGQDQLSALFSQRFKDRDAAPAEQAVAEKASRKRGRPPKAVQRKTVSFFLLPKLAERLDDAYYAWNAGLSKETRISRAEFRRQVVEFRCRADELCGTVDNGIEEGITLHEARHRGLVNVKHIYLGCDCLS